MEDNTKVSVEAKSIYAITNLDAEDLGSSILKTYTTADEAYSELEKIEAGTHEDFFAGGILDVFEIKVPSDYASQQTEFLQQENEGLKDRWINVKDKLPETGQFVLTYVPNIDMVCRDQYRHFEEINKTDFVYKGVSHWMPLPEKPS